MRRELPSGTVTFLFTDVEGSTRLLHSLGADGYAGALAEHRRVIREACAAQGGVEVDTQGDAFFFAFPTAPGALAAASAFTEALASGPIQVRVGLHTGMPLLTDEGYVGDDVHFAARVAASAHGGQVILSSATAELVEELLADLGEHRLKDIAEAVPLFQLGDGSFPPLKTISNTNLPRPASSFLGREAELGEVLARVAGGARLVTLTGPGGTGKTRLALEAAASLVGEYKAGVFWVGLAALRDPALVTETIAQTLGAKDVLAEHIGERELLLLLDNLEQVIEAASELSGLLAACPNLTLLVTSRELLRVQGEVEYPVPPLAEPEAVALFCERSQLEPSDEIRQLCARLDSLPLAVELAAARTKALTPAQILERLADRLDLLKGGRDSVPRQQTLRATIEWSYDLLTEEEQQLFAHLSVFAGGCTLEAADEVAYADLDALQSLVEKSLLRFSTERYWMLETVREYARERLAGLSQAEQMASRHARHYAGQAVALGRSMYESAAEAIATLDEERPNMRAAMDFVLQRDDAVLAGDLMWGLWAYWLMTGSGGEAADWSRRYLESGRTRLSPLARVAGDKGASEVLRFTGDTEGAFRLKREIVDVGRSNPDAIVHGWPISRITAPTLSDLAYMELDAGRVQEARSYAEEALELRRALGLPAGIAHALCVFAFISYRELDFQGSQRLLAEALSNFRSAGARDDMLHVQLLMAGVDVHLGQDAEARTLLREIGPLLRDGPERSMHAGVFRVAGMLAERGGDPERCATLFGTAARIVEESGITMFTETEEEIHGAYRDRARADLGSDAFELAYKAGAEASDEEAWELALASLD